MRQRRTAVDNHFSQRARVHIRKSNYIHISTHTDTETHTNTYINTFINMHKHIQTHTQEMEGSTRCSIPPSADDDSDKWFVVSRALSEKFDDGDRLGDKEKIRRLLVITSSNWSTEFARNSWMKEFQHFCYYPSIVLFLSSHPLFFFRAVCSPNLNLHPTWIFITPESSSPTPCHQHINISSSPFSCSYPVESELRVFALPHRLRR